jgi:hypothetical protein
MVFGKHIPNPNGSPLLSTPFAHGQVSEPSVATMTIAATSKIRKSAGAIVLAVHFDC